VIQLYNSVVSSLPLEYFLYLMPIKLLTGKNGPRKKGLL
jgi:hypothetical protein